MKDLGAAQKILGMEIYRDRSKKKLFLSHKSYIQKILSRFGMSSAKPLNTPSASNVHLSSAYAPQSEAENGFIYLLSFSLDCLCRPKPEPQQGKSSRSRCRCRRRR
ncbi:unnamed protein product [Linum trigynum]|uniref:Reverse transcriptase Ty1/copia-type domain-containing protein n=1 Tax=Linum trigynum TaxID=586398 RepID=A0AAV2EC51_9ROSI